MAFVPRMYIEEYHFPHVSFAISISHVPTLRDIEPLMSLSAQKILPSPDLLSPGNTAPSMPVLGFGFYS